MEIHDIASIIAALEKAAQTGNAEASYRLGLICANGDGVPLDYAKSADHFRKAADAGVGAAMRALAMLHAAGYGVPQNSSETQRLLIAGAEAGDVEAQFATGTMFHFGHHGAEPNAKLMLHWYQHAAEQNHAKAQFALGKLMAAGDKVKQNDEAAFQWLTLAIMNGNEPAKKELAMLTARVSEDQLQAFRQRMMERIASGG
jgi:TPR repeat protein